MNALGRALAQHRGTCDRCTPQRACGRYLDIARAHTEPRKRWDGPLAARTVLSVREDAPPAPQDVKISGPGGVTHTPGTPGPQNGPESRTEASR